MIGLRRERISGKTEQRMCWAVDVCIKQHVCVGQAVFKSMYDRLESELKYLDWAPCVAVRN